MVNKEKSHIVVIVTVFLAILMGALFVNIIAQNSNQVTALQWNVNQSADISSARLYTMNRSAQIANQTLVAVSNTTGNYLAPYLLTGVICSVYNITNATGGEIIWPGNYTIVNCHVSTLGTTKYNDQDLNVTYNYTYKNNIGAINTTYQFTAGGGAGNWQSNYPECTPSSLLIYNQTGALLTVGNYTYTAYPANATGTLTLANTPQLNQSSSNITYVTFSYCPEGYINGWARTVLNLVPGLFIIGVLGVGIYFLYNTLRDQGIF
jgi:hypothetical protein